MSCWHRDGRRGFGLVVALAAALWLADAAVTVALSQAEEAAAGDSRSSGLIALPPGTEADRPSFLLDDLAGVQYELSKTRANLVLVHFFATWCEPCREELPALQRLIQRDGSGNLAVLALSVGEPDERVRRFFATMPLSFPILLDRDRAVAKIWGVQTLPSTFVLNRELKPRLMAEGEFEWDRFKPEELSEAVGSGH
ncbi:MAG TPA: TlpA disulfide reductase family protein [Xanthobacteraceae bacterium]